MYYTLKNKGASIEEPFLSKWFHEEPLIFVSQKLICGERRFFRLYKGKEEMFFKEPLTECFFLNQKWLFYAIAVKNLLSTFIFKSVCFSLIMFLFNILYF